MDPVTVSVTIDAPLDAIFEYLADVANHAEFTDHFQKSWRLTREESYGLGAGARFHSERPFTRYGWQDITLVDLDPPRRIVAHGRGGMFNRVRSVSVWELEPGPGATTRVSHTTETAPATLSDRLSELLGQRGWTRRRWSRALKRLRAIFERGEQQGERATIAGGARKPASAYRYRPPTGTPG